MGDACWVTHTFPYFGETKYPISLKPKTLHRKSGHIIYCENNKTYLTYWWDSITVTPVISPMVGQFTP